MYALGWWSFTSDEGLPDHVVPMNDIVPHRVQPDGDCWCLPVDKEGTYVHNAYDRRELYEDGTLRLS